MNNVKPAGLDPIKVVRDEERREDALCRVARIMQSCGMPLWGACGFAAFSERLLPCRAKGRLPEQARSILCALFPYALEERAHNISRYAMPPDYHGIVMDMLEAAVRALSAVFPSHRFVPFADNSPIPEVAAAARCGLGAVGEHGLLIHPMYGSWVFIGEIVTDLPLPVQEREVESCLRCGACRKACPGGALQENSFFKERCVSHISQKKGGLTEEEAALLQKSGLIWGCDRCQEVCPMNWNARPTPLAAFRENAVGMVDEAELGQLEGRAYGWRGEAVLRRNLRIFRGNRGDTKAKPPEKAETDGR